MSDIVNNALAIIKNAAPLIAGLTGSPLIGIAVKIGEEALELGKQIKANHQVENQDELDARLAELEAAVSAHVDSTAASLQ